MEVLPGRYNSLTISLLQVDNLTDRFRQDLLDEIRTRAVGAKGAIFVDVPEQHLGAVLDILLDRKLIFHRCQDKIYTYYLWNVKNEDGTPIEDKVPAYATSSEGVGALIYSPDHTQVLLVWEYDRWKVVTGGLKPGEQLLETLIREVHEEVGLTIRLNSMTYLGGWQHVKCEFGQINNNFRVFAVDATSLDFQVDNEEIYLAKWWSIYDLHAIAHVPCPNGNPMFPVEAYGTKFSWLMLQWLVQGRMGPRVHSWGSLTAFY